MTKSFARQQQLLGLIEDTSDDSESLENGSTKSQETSDIKSSLENMDNKGQTLGANKGWDLEQENQKQSRF